MKLSDFLQYADNQKWWEDQKVICFRSAEFPGNFFNFLFKKIESFFSKDNKVQFLTFANNEPSTIFSSLSQSFLGESYFYWLSEFSNKIDKKTDKIFKFLSTYTGPHKVMFLLENSVEIDLSKFDNVVLVELDEELDLALFNKILKFFEKNSLIQKKQIITKIFKAIPNITVPKALMVSEYLELVGEGTTEELEIFLGQIFGSKESLSNLVKHFFAKDSDSFFKCWKSISFQYPEIFWISYWSELLWQAYCAKILLDNGKSFDAKRIGWKLGFSFFSAFYRNLNLNEIKNAHNFIYMADYKLKLGSDFPQIDLFYLKYFSEEFSKNGLN